MGRRCPSYPFKTGFKQPVAASRCSSAAGRSRKYARAEPPAYSGLSAPTRRSRPRFASYAASNAPLDLRSSNTRRAISGYCLLLGPSIPFPRARAIRSTSWRSAAVMPAYGSDILIPPQRTRPAANSALRQPKAAPPSCEVSGAVSERTPSWIRSPFGSPTELIQFHSARIGRKRRQTLNG